MISPLPNSFSEHQDLEIIVGRIRYHASRLLKPGISGNDKMYRLRQIIRTAQDEYDRILKEEDSKNFVLSDPIITASFGGID